MKEYFCHFCNKSFMDYMSQREARGAKYFFCSRVCKYQWNKTLPGYWKGKKMSEQAKLNMANNRASVIGEKNPNWKGGRRVDKTGYILIWKPSHPNSDSDGYIREHRLLVEKKIGRYLKSEEVVHHVNHNRQDNRIKNLIILSNGAEHQRIHYHNGDSKHLKNYTP